MQVSYGKSALIARKGEVIKPEKTMAILYDKSTGVYTLHTKKTTYQMMVDRFGYLLHLYYGRKTEGCMDYLLSYRDRGFSGNPYEAGSDRTYSLDALPQEFPVTGTGDYRSTALTVKNKDGSVCCNLRFSNYRIYDGKYGLEGLPAVYAERENQDAQTLEIELADAVSGIRVVLLYGVFPEYDVITRSVRITNEGYEKCYLEKAGSCCLDFVTGNYDVISFYGRHAMEKNVQRMPISHGNFVIGSRRGNSSHQYNPTMIFAEQNATEDTGTCYALAFVYSGGFKGEVEKDQYDQTRVLMGIQDELFSYPLERGEIFYVPETVMSCSVEGLSVLSHNLHRCFRKNLCRGKFKEAVRPILINSWEACYFDFSGDDIVRLAEQAADVGIEMLVMDDGWFGERRDDNRALGDWYVNEKKLGCTIKELSERIHALGMKFGLWIEPEMISENSDLYRQHPDWALKNPRREPIRSRNQLVLDFSRKEVREYVFKKITAILDSAKIEYVKWDMNRSIADVFSIETEEQGKVLYDYMLGVYKFLEDLQSRFPELLIEGCSGGGGRFDAGMLYYTPQIWASDNTDAIDRLRIQYGNSFCFPVSSVGAHVSAVPNHQTGRATPLYTRGIVATAGTFGYELDLGALLPEEKEEIRAQVKSYRRHASLIQTGLYYRLSNPYEDAVTAWEFISEDGNEILIQGVLTEIHGNMLAVYVKPKGLDEESLYQEMESGKCFYGGALMQYGLLLQENMKQYQAFQLHFIKKYDV